MNRIKEALFKLGIGERPSLERHDKILEEMESVTVQARVTIEEYAKLRGFPYSRSIRRAHA